MIPNDATGVGLKVDRSVGSGVDEGRGVTTVGETVIDDTGATEGAPVIKELGDDSEYVTFLTAVHPHKYILPAVSTAMPYGEQIDADVASPPSPSMVYLRQMRGAISLLPATVVMMPVLAVILRMRLFCESAKKTLPCMSTETEVGLFMSAVVARMLSPL